MRNLKSLLILFIVATSIFLIFPHKSFAGFSCSASGSTATFSLTGCPNPTVPAVKFGANLSFPWSASTIRSPFAQCSSPAFVGNLPSGYYYFGAYDSNDHSLGGCSVSIVGSGSGGGSVILPPPPSTGTIAVSISGISSASYTITGPTTITGTNSATYSEPAGTYTIVWGAVAGYASPSSQSLVLPDGGTITFSGTFVLLPPPVGTIAVSISGISSASYTITGPATITGTNSATYSSNPTGTYTIVWGAVAGYTSPSSQSLVLPDGGTITFSGTFVQTGTVVVIVSGVSSSSWRVAQVGSCGMFPIGTFYDYSGSSSSSSLPSGCSYTVTWNTVAGYTTPAAQSFTVSSGGNTLVGNYISKSDLTAGLVTPVTATTGTSISFTSSIKNIGSGNTVVNSTLLGTYTTAPLLSYSNTYDLKQNAIWITNNSTITKLNALNGNLISSTILGAPLYSPVYDVTQNAVWVVDHLSPLSLHKIDASNGNLLGSYCVGDGSSCDTSYGFVYDVTQNAVWVTISGLNKVVKRNASNGAFIGLYSVGTYPVGIAYDVTQNAVWITNWDSTITKLNALNGNLLGTYAVGSAHSPQIAYDVTQNAVWVANGDSTVTKMNASNGAIIDTYPTGGSCYITYDVTQNAVWVTGCSTSPNVTKLNALTGALISNYNLSGNGISYDSKQNAIWINSIWVNNILPMYVTKLDASTGPGFYNFFQVATAADGGGTITDLASSTMSVLAAGGSAVATSSPYTFATAGTYSVRACADNTSSAGGGVVPESNENNNCGAWTNITVTTTSGTPTGSITTNDCTITSGSTCPATVSWTTSNATSTSIQQNGIEFSTSLSGSISRNISYGLNTFMLFNGLSLLDTKYAVGSVSDQGKTGAANGTTRDTAPSTYAELCASGTASAVTTTANGWSWTCGSGIGIVNGMATKTSTAVCGNSTCEYGETLLSCPKDCKGKVQQF